MLENHADILARLPQLAVAKRRHILAVNDDLAARGPLQHIDASHQRRLAGATQADNAKNLALGDFQINAL